MANEEHLVMLLRMDSSRRWNDWRDANPHERPDLSHTRLDGMDLTGMNFRNSNLQWANLAGANLSDANFRDADMTYAILTRANLSRADLMQTVMRHVDLSSANLEDAGVRGTDLTFANLTDAVLVRAIMNGAILSETILSGTNFKDAIFTHCSFSYLSLVGAKGLGSLKQSGPSSIGFDVIEQTAADLAGCSSDEQQATEIFLEGSGVPKEYIELFRSRIGKPIQFYSAFISYSTKDQEFADRLYADLRQKSIRCWLATEDLKIGDKFRTRINDAIRVHDKLLLVLSETSINSAWVEAEVEAAFEKERKTGNVVLFPVRLDDAIMDTDKAWAEHIRQTRHIGDFRKWKDHDEYQKALARLIRDLQADGKTQTAQP
jgi:uncharacterized protein YjbI with pentapeptide repeats